jgi:hypothetical protein
MGLLRIRWVGRPNSWAGGWCSVLDLCLLIFIVVAAVFVGTA